jgi:integrase
MAGSQLPNFLLPSYYSLPTSINVVLNAVTSCVGTSSSSYKSAPATSVTELKPVESRLHHLRDGEVVLYKIPRSTYWQVRFRLYEGKWIRFSTRKRNLDDAMRLACDRYDEARFRERQGLPPVVKRFEDIAKSCVAEMRTEITAGTGKRIYRDYIQVIERYFVPFFGQMYMTSITAKEIGDFETWRNEEMKKRPKASTLLTFASAFNRLHQTAVARGWVSDKFPAPKFTTKGDKGQARPAFTKDEIVQIRELLTTWHLSVEGKTQEMRRMLRDYVDVLILTGMRAGTESMSLCWKHIEWHIDKEVRYLRIWVSGKTGPRWLIAKHECVEALKRLHLSQPDIEHLDFEEVISAKLPHKLFRFEDGTEPYEFTHVFTRFMKESQLMKSTMGTNRTLYSLRHTYATNELLAGTDIHTLAKQMGTSVLMLEKHYSKMTATMAAAKLA